MPSRSSVPCLRRSFCAECGEPGDAVRLFSWGQLCPTRAGREGRTVDTARSSRVIALVAGVAVALALPLAASAASGDLDGTFGTAGKVTTDFAGNDDEAHGVAVQSD